MILIRFALIGLIVYLVVRSFMRYGEDDNHTGSKTPVNGDNGETKKVSKKIGEYIDYEELDKQK